MKILGKLGLFAGAGFLGAGLGDLIMEMPFLDGIAHAQDGSGQFDLLPVTEGFWFGSIGAMTSFALALASVFYRRGSRHLLEAFQAMLGGFAVTMPIGMLAQYLYTSIGPTEVLRTFCWGLAGGLLGAAISFRVPNLGVPRGFAGGFVGGVLGAVAFIFVANELGDMAARLIGVPLIGLCLGAMLVVAEGVFRSIWIEVTIRGQKRVMPLGKSWLAIGSDARRCSVLVPGAPVAERFRLSGRMIQREEMVKAATRQVMIGDSFNIGPARIVVCGRIAPTTQRAGQGAVGSRQERTGR